jgi:hypothetical protein
MEEEQKKLAMEGWWNGVNIIVKDPINKLKQMFPSTERSRLLYENEHIIHSMALAQFAPLGLSLIQNISNLNFLRVIEILFKNLAAIRKSKKELNIKFNSMLTYSDKLASQNINKTINELQK